MMSSTFARRLFPIGALDWNFLELKSSTKYYANLIETFQDGSGASIARGGKAEEGV